MTKDEKNLLLKDLCGRLPYGVEVQVDTYGTVYDARIEAVWPDGTVYVVKNESDDALVDVTEVKPYLFPLSTLSVPEMNEIVEMTNCNFPWDLLNEDGKLNWSVGGLVESELFSLTLEQIDCISEWFKRNGYDYLGLIEKGLAVERKQKMQ